MRADSTENYIAHGNLRISLVDVWKAVFLVYERFLITSTKYFFPRLPADVVIV